MRKTIDTIEEAAELSDYLLQVKKGMVISIRYFKEDTEHPAIPPLGTYETVNGKVEMVDGIFRQITISDGSTKVTVHFDDLEEVSGEDIVNIDEFLGDSTYLFFYVYSLSHLCRSQIVACYSPRRGV